MMLSIMLEVLTPSRIEHSIILVATKRKIVLFSVSLS